MKRAVLEARCLAWDRDRSQCNRCAYVTYSVQLHHRRIKGMGGDTRDHTDCPCNLIALCPPCHDHIHTVDRRGAEAEGFIVSRDCPLPAEVGVMRYSATASGMTMRPDCEGGWAA